MLSVIGTVFAGSKSFGDFGWMIEQDKYSDGLFIFNDNEEQFLQFRDHPEDVSGWGCTPGGGNAIIRPFQCKIPPRAAGIPTGPDYFQLTARIRILLDEAISRVETIVREYRYRRIFYSAADESGLLGQGIFHVSLEVRDYITMQLRALERNE